MHPFRRNARVLTGAMVGTAVEFYDFFIYATAAALVFGPLFFPSFSTAAQTLLAFMTFGIAFVARPVGAIAFGHFGDRVGRKSTLVVSLLLMGGSTLAIAFLPTYATAGVLAPGLLCLMRFGQGFALGGEWGGAALLAVENAPAGWESRFVAVMQLGSPIGYFAANAVFMLVAFLLSDAQFMAWGWRLPFLGSAVLVAAGLWVRLRIEETPQFRAAMSRHAPVRVPFVAVLSEHAVPLLAGSAGVVMTFATFYLATAWALAEASGPLGYARIDVLAVQLLASLFYAGAIILAGIHADRTSPGRTLLVAAIGVGLIGLGFGPALHSGSLALATLGLCATMFALGLANGPLGSWLSSLFPVGVRYSGVSLAFNIGGIVGGALTPLVAQAMSARGAGAGAGLLLTVAAILSLVGVASVRDRTRARHP
ncbi:MAG: MFS transporter [Novosphingobium sp.]